MATKVYDLKRTEKDILAKVHGSGWNPYNSTDTSSIGAEGVIRRGPAEQFQLNERYVMMPRITDNKDPEKVFGALERIARDQLDRQPPTIEIGGERFSWTGFIPRKGAVKVNSEVGHYISYQDFLRALDTITKIKP